MNILKHFNESLKSEYNLRQRLNIYGGMVVMPAMANVYLFYGLGGFEQKELSQMAVIEGIAFLVNTPFLLQEILCGMTIGVVSAHHLRGDLYLAKERENRNLEEENKTLDELIKKKE